MKNILLLIIITTSSLAYSQNVGIGTNAPDASAKLEIQSANTGLLIPNVSIGNVSLAAPVTTPATGLLVWNANAATTGGSGTGYYYWNGTVWVRLSTTIGTLTLANNGLYVFGGNTVRLGGSLLQNTTITQFNSSMNFRLNGFGDFNILDNNLIKFQVDDLGNTRLGGNTFWNISSTTGMPIARMLNTGNAARFDLLYNGGIQHQFMPGAVTFNEQGISANFRVESNINPYMLFVQGNANRVGIGTIPTHTLHVNGSARISNLGGAGTRMVVASNAGILFTQALPLGDITSVTAGNGLIGGGAIGNVTINAVAINGLTATANDIRLGGTLMQSTTIVQGIYSMTYNLNSGGDFIIRTNTKPNAFRADANANVIRFGSATGSLFGNGTVVGGNTVDYVVDFDRGTATGTTIGVGSIEYMLDGSSETQINNSFSPTTHLNRNLGFSTTLRAWNNVYANNFVNVSDRREKNNIQDLSYGLEEVLQMRAVSYKLNRDPFGETKLGLIAQETLLLVPEAVRTHDYRVLDESKPDEFTKVELERMGMTYQTLIPVLIKATQEQQEIIVTQGDRIEQLEKELQEIKNILQK